MVSSEHRDNNKTSKVGLGSSLTRRAFLRVFGLVSAPLLIGGFAGCRPMDTLTETIYADWAEDIDYDNPTKSLKNAPDKSPTTSLPKLYETDSEDIEQEMEDPVYDETSTNSEGQAPKTEYSESSENDEKNTSGKQEKAKEEPEEEIKEPEESAGEKQAQVGGNTVGKNASKNVTDAPDQFGSVIAFGEIANLVCLLGGTGALWAADDEFLDAAKEIYAAGTVADVHSGWWTSYASSGKTISSKNFKKLTAELDALKEDQRPVYFIYDGAVGCPITETQAATLEETYGIKTRYFFLNTVNYFKNTMNYLKKVLLDSYEHDASKVFDEYWKFHDTLLAEVNDGKVAVWESSGTLLNFKDGSKYATSDVMDESKAYWTLYINDWDKGASYSFGKVKPTYGLGYSRLGYSWSPLSYYLQQGGVINNAAARWQASANNFNSDAEYYRYVWQLAAYFGATSKYVTGGALSGSNNTISNNAEGDILLRAQSGKFGLGKLEGVGRFPALIVPNSTIKGYLEKDRDSGNGAYSPYYLKANETGNNPNDPVMGIAYKSSDTSKAGCWVSYIGREEGDIDERTADTCIASEKYSKTTKCFDVLINPHGVYSNWVAGSAESFLEAAWAYEAIVQEYDESAAALSTSYGSSAQEVVQTFYEMFYGKSLSSNMAKKVLNGGYAS